MQSRRFHCSIIFDFAHFNCRNFAIPVDAVIDCMDLWELACGQRGIPQDKSQRLGVLALREERRWSRLRRFYHYTTHWMLADQLTKYSGYFSKTLLEMVSSGHWTVRDPIRCRHGFGPSDKNLEENNN